MWVVVITGETYPEAMGPYRSPDKADRIADEWNRTRSDEGEAHVRPLKRRFDEIDV